MRLDWISIDPAIYGYIDRDPEAVIDLLHGGQHLLQTGEYLLQLGKDGTVKFREHVVEGVNRFRGAFGMILGERNNKKPLEKVH